MLRCTWIKGMLLFFNCREEKWQTYESRPDISHHARLIMDNVGNSKALQRQSPWSNLNWISSPPFPPEILHFLRSLLRSGKILLVLVFSFNAKKSNWLLYIRQRQREIIKLSVHQKKKKKIRTFLCLSLSQLNNTKEKRRVFIFMSTRVDNSESAIF